MSAVQNVGASLVDVLDATPSQVAVRKPGQEGVRYGALARTVRGLAAYLRRRGMRPGDRVLVHVPDGPGFVASVAASLCLGAVPVLAEPRLGRQVYASCVRAAAPRWHLVHPLLLGLDRTPGVVGLLHRRGVDLPTMPRSARRVLITGGLLRGLGTAERLLPTPTSHIPSRGDDAIIVFTGGTSARPKGVRLSHDALGAYLAHIGSAIEGLPSFRRFLADTPQQVLYAIRLGKTAVTVKGRGARRARAIREAITNGEVDAYFGSPSVWVQMLADGALEGHTLPSSLRAVLLGGAPVTPAFLRELRPHLAPNTVVRCLYGLTEVGPACMTSMDEKLGWSEDGDLVGEPLAGVDIRVVDPGQGGAGDVVIHGPSLFTGYLHDPPREPDAPLETGDLGRLVDTANGRRLVLMGRRKDMIIRDGVNLYPSALEPVVAALQAPNGEPWVRQCALVGIYDETRADERLALAVVPRDVHLFDMAAFSHAVDAALGSAARPDIIVPLDTFPTVGRLEKIDKVHIRALCTEHLALQQG